ncbi:tripartite tricarboxylate transporter TctB family protein [Pseudoflavonifractor sp. 60]|uniref:tripartite tricarboxylate transporter TctB family protein n=1 Tax=Pseudoflavonifractor sp. 60 TaxID=2304576 RepID=UPI00136D1012
MAGIFIVLGAAGLILEWVSIRKEGLKLPLPQLRLTQYIPQIVMVAAGFLFILLADFLGFLPASIIFIGFVLFLFGSRNWKFNLVFAVVYGVLIFLLFSKILGIRFIGGLIRF